MTISEMKVLICDDSMLVRKKLADILTKLGIASIFNASNGEEAVEAYKTNKPDIVFMDIVMPGKTGLEALVDIKEYDKNAKVVMVSTIGTQSNLIAAVKAGAYEFMQKPVNADEAEKIINKVLKEKN